MGKLAGTVGGASIAATIAALGWPGAAMVIGLCVVILALLAWVVADHDRSQHLTMLFLALRGKRE